VVQIWEVKSIEKSLLSRLKIILSQLGVVRYGVSQVLGRLWKVPWLLTRRGDPRARCVTHAGFVQGGAKNDHALRHGSVLDPTPINPK